MSSSPHNEISVDAARPLFNIHNCQRMIATVPARVENSSIGEIFAHQTLTLQKTDCRRILCAKDLTLHQCPQLGWVAAKGAISTNKCKNVKILIAGTALTIFDSIIHDYAFSHGSATISNSEIKGQLVCTSNELIISDSKINFMYMGLVKLIRDHFQQKITLRNSTLHSIQFEGQSGIIVLEGSSTVTGSIVGGKILSANTP